MTGELLVSLQALFFHDLPLLERVKVSLDQGLRGEELVRAATLPKPSRLQEVLRFHQEGYGLLEKRIRALKGEILPLHSPLYPSALKEGYGPPAVLFLLGDPNLLSSPLLSVVGTRTPTPYGINTTGLFCRKLASWGITIVSGLARGIDTQAHRGALESGKTIAVLGSGLDRVYPAVNLRLAADIARSGVLLSEFPPGTGGKPFHFPLRNRIIAYLSPATLVVEARKRSGSLITANLAVDAGRDVFALPGDINRSTSEGTNELLNKGARPALSPEEILLALPYGLTPPTLPPPRDLPPQEQALLSLLPQGEEREFDELAEASSMGTPELMSLLLKLQLKGLVMVTPLHRYRRS